MYQPIGACLPFYALNFLFILSNSSFLFLSFFFLSVLLIFVVILLEVPITLFMIFFPLFSSLCTTRVPYIVLAVIKFYYFSL